MGRILALRRRGHYSERRARGLVKTIEQDQFAYADPAVFVDEPLVIHKRKGSTNANLVVFVHGLGGSPCGPSPTWGDFPKFVLEDFASADVALYGYLSFHKRWQFWKSVPLEDEARLFAGILRDALKGYRQIVLVGHSMGGLLCKAAICELLRTKATDGALDRIAGLFLMATPSLGSVRVPRLLTRWSFDARALVAHGSLVTHIQRTFEDSIALNEQIFTYRRTTIPTWAVEGVHDRWVDSLSSGIGLVSDRRKLVRGSHQSVVKPASKNADAYQWVRERIKICFDRFKYDVFVGTAMAAIDDLVEYKRHMREALTVIEALESIAGFARVYFAARNIDDRQEFQPSDKALIEDLEALRSSRHFLFYYPEEKATSAIYEAGWALVLGKPSVYLVRDAAELPFLLRESSQAFPEPLVRIVEAPDAEAAGTKIVSYGETLFRSV